MCLALCAPLLSPPQLRSVPKPVPQQQDLAGGTWWHNCAPGPLGVMRCSQVLLICPWVWFSVVTTPSSVVLLQLGNLISLGQVLLLGCSSHLTCVGMGEMCGCPGLRGVPPTSREEILLLTTLISAYFQIRTFPSGRPTNLSIDSGANNEMAPLDKMLHFVCNRWGTF